MSDPQIDLTPSIRALLPERQKGWEIFTKAITLNAVATALLLVAMLLVFVVWA